jgi:leader peptidase (prepilin peptidase)/N-methyltransferase
MTLDLWLLLSLLLGLLAASFIGLVSLRWPREQPIAWARSACASCGRKLSPLELTPILGFLALRGRCRSCKDAIPRRYLLLELACPLAPLWVASVKDGPEIVLGAALAWTLLLLALLDGEHFWLPDALTLPLGAAGLAAAAWLGEPALTDAALGAALGFSGFWLLAAAYRRVRGREGLGGGDARLLGAAGAWVGWIGLPSVLLWASLSGLCLVLVQRARGRTLEAEQPIPFGVFLALGLWLTWLYGPLGL